jgi:enoyl-CoA hydratase/carnithine racemase
VTPQLSISGHRAVIRLDAPERRNAVGPDDLRALARAFDEIERNAEVDVAILRATGDTFCAGYDLAALRRERGTPEGSAAQRTLARAIDTLENLRVPTICAIDGGAYGAGTDLALACDLRIGTPRATLTVPAARFGLQFYSGGLRRYVERLGIDAAKRIFFLADTLDANELHRIGFLHEVVSSDALNERIDVLAERLLANAPAAIRGLKRSLNTIARGSSRPEAIDDAFLESFADAELGERGVR